MFTCPFCQKSIKSVYALEKHKTTCLKNPENQEILQKSPFTINEVPYLKTLPMSLQKRIKVSYSCEKCSRERTQNLLSIVFTDRNSIICPNCRQTETTKKHNLEKYGVGNVMQVESVKQKNYETCIKNYGTKRPCQNEEIHKKMDETCIRLYGFVRPNQKPEIQNKIKETVLQRYDVENVMQLDFVKEVHSWSNKTAEQQQNQIQKRLDTMRARFGKQMSEKLRKTKELRYGNSNYCNVEKALDTKMQRYGTLSLLRHFIFDNEAFDSKPELAFWIYCKEHNIDIHRNHTDFFVFTAQGKEHRYYPDFMIGSDFIEIKSDHFVKDDSTWQNPFDHSQDKIFEAKHQCALQNGVKIYYSADYQKYVDYVENKYSKDFLNLFNTQLPFPYLNPDLKEKTDLAIIQHFHKSIYEASKKGELSPLQAWQDKDIIKKVALNRLKYVKRCTPSDILQGLSVTRIAPKISVFKPNLAERLIKQYLNEFEEVVDPFSGFSGRLLGTVKCEKRYIGKDINEKHVKESNEIIRYKNCSDCVVTVEDLLQKSDVEVHDCLFTCPPYGGKEHWNENNDEVEKSCDEWIDLCLQYYKCKRYLFVVDETEKYRGGIVENLQHKNGLFANKHEYVILIDTLG